MLLRRCTDTEIRFGTSLSYLPSHSQACLTLHCQQLRPVGHRKAVRIQHRPGTGKAFCVRRGHAFLPGRASGQDGNVDGASRVAGGMRGHSAGRAAGMGAGPGRPHASPAGHHDQENETVARMIGKPDARRKIWRTPRMDQPAKFVIRFFETVTHGDPA